MGDSVENCIVIRVCDFTITPWLQYKDEPCSVESGQEFRDEILLPAILDAIKKRYSIIVDLDGTLQYTHGWLAEAFGGLISNSRLNASQLHSLIKFKSEENPDLIDDVVSILNKDYSM